MGKRASDRSKFSREKKSTAELRHEFASGRRTLIYSDRSQDGNWWHEREREKISIDQNIASTWSINLLIRSSVYRTRQLTSTNMSSDWWLIRASQRNFSRWMAFFLRERINSIAIVDSGVVCTSQSLREREREKEWHLISVDEWKMNTC